MSNRRGVLLPILDGWALKSGTVYPALHRLVELGFIEGEEVEQDDRPDAIVYRLTSNGQKMLAEALKGLDSELRVQDSLWGFLGRTVSASDRKALLKWATRERSPMGFVVMRGHCASGKCAPSNLDFLQKYREYLQQELDWIDAQLARLKSSKDK